MLCNPIYATNVDIDNNIELDSYYECEHPFIVDLSVKITKNLSGIGKTSKILENMRCTLYPKRFNRLEICQAVFKWMKDNVEYEYPIYYNSKHYAVGTAILGKGNCCDQARLFIALCRAAGIPHNATEFGCSDAVQFKNGNIYGHIWPVITLENGTKIICDTTTNNNKINKITWKNIGHTTYTKELKT